MTITSKLLVASAFAVALLPAVGPAQARTHRHHTAGHAVRAQTRANDRSPGTAKALTTETKQSATGGQAGGRVGQE